MINLNWLVLHKAAALEIVHASHGKNPYGEGCAGVTPDAEGKVSGKLQKRPQRSDLSDVAYAKHECKACEKQKIGFYDYLLHQLRP